MKLFSVLSILVVLILVLAPTTLAANVAAPANSCAVTWGAVSVPNVGNLYAVKAISATDIWVGGEGDFLHWNGATWSQVTKPAAAKVRHFSAIAPNDVWALASDVVDSSDGHIFHWNGSTWSEIAVPDTDWFGDIAALGPNDLWLVGYNRAFHWNGALWEEHSPDLDVYPIFYSATVAGGQLYAAGLSGYRLELATLFKWNGTSWTSAYTSQQGSFTSTTTDTTNNVWAIGPTIPSALAVEWNGTAGSTSAIPDTYNAVTALAADDAYVVGKNILHWDGSEWVLNFNTAEPLRGVSAVSATDVWAVGDASTVLHGTSPCAPTGCAQQATPRHPNYNARVKPLTVLLKWANQNCATTYRYALRQDSQHGTIVARGRTAKTKFKTPDLAPGHDYTWRIRACNAVSCGNWSYWQKFHIKP